MVRHGHAVGSTLAPRLLMLSLSLSFSFFLSPCQHSFANWLIHIKWFLGRCAALLDEKTHSNKIHVCPSLQFGLLDGTVGPRRYPTLCSFCSSLLAARETSRTWHVIVEKKERDSSAWRSTTTRCWLGRTEQERPLKRVMRNQPSPRLIRFRCRCYVAAAAVENKPIRAFKTWADPSAARIRQETSSYEKNKFSSRWKK